MEELTMAQAIVKAGDSLGYAIVVAALIRGFLNK
tara:strand:+ start:1392 stop:1493 length:102 start_codon:yes stop_codon:yes gene_type:complete